MTYLQLMIKCLTFFKNEKEKFDNDDFYYFWLNNEDDDIDIYYKSEAKKAILYLMMLETKKYSKTNNTLLNQLEKDLSYFTVSICKTLERAQQKTITSIIEDPYMFDQMCLLFQDELDVNEQHEIINLMNEFEKHIPDEYETIQIESAIHTVMEMVSQIIPELFFTERGYEYIDKEYQIDDVELRKRCYEYMQENIDYYNNQRIYMVDENIYSELYDSEEEIDEFEDYDDNEDYEDYEDEDYEDLDKEDVYLNGDEIRGQVSIYGEDIDNYDILYYSTTLLVVMLRFIKSKQYDKLERLMQIDETMTNFFENVFDTDKTLIEALYQPKTMGHDYHKEISTSSKSDFCLDFFLSNNEFTQQYDTQQLSLIIAHCFDLFDSEPINKMVKNIDAINDVLATNSLDNRDEKIKRLVKIKKDNNK